MEINIYEMITGVGFPIAVAVYLLVYMRKSLDSLKEVISKNTETITKLCEHLTDKENNKNA